MRSACGAIRQALANNLQPFTVFLEVNAAQVRGHRAFVAVDLFVGLFGTANHHLLVLHTHAVKLLKVMLPALNKYVAAACVHTVLDDRHFTARLFTCRVFCPVDKAAQVTLFHPAETVDFFLNVNAVTKRRYRRLGNGEVYVVTQRENMDQHIVLGCRSQAFTVRDKVF